MWMGGCEDEKGREKEIDWGVVELVPLLPVCDGCAPFGTRDRFGLVFEAYVLCTAMIAPPCHVWRHQGCES
jgi:hypothetical protein